MNENIYFLLLIPAASFLIGLAIGVMIRKKITARERKHKIKAEKRWIESEHKILELQKQLDKF